MFGGVSNRMKKFNGIKSGIAFVVIWILAFGGLSHAKAQTDKILEKELDIYIIQLMKKLPVTPGLAVAVVRGDKVIFVKGFGFRNLKDKLPVTLQTGFYIASTTKSFTGTAAKLLAEEGKLDLDAPIKKYFPDLVLKAPLSTDQISVRDLLTHRSGISNEAINLRTAYTGQYDSEILLKLLADYSKPIPPDFFGAPPRSWR